MLKHKELFTVLFFGSTILDFLVFQENLSDKIENVQNLLLTVVAAAVKNCRTVEECNFLY